MKSSTFLIPFFGNKKLLKTTSIYSKNKLTDHIK